MSWLPVPRWLAMLLLFSVSYGTQSLAQVSSCTATYTCPSGVNECYRLNGGGQVSTRPVPGTFASEAACTTYVINANPKGQSISCSCQGGSAGASGAATTGSTLGDALNLGANLWIIQNVKNPYTAVFAQNFTQGFLTGLFSNNNSNPEAQRQQQLAYEAFQRQQREEAERARIAEQQRIDAIYARLNRQLKLSGNTSQLALKTGGPVGDLPMKLSSGPDSGLKLKLGDTATAGYGIQGLPGIYVGGPAENSGGLELKLGDSSTPATATTQPVPPMGIPGLPGLNLSNVEPSQAAQLADAATTLTGPERSMAEDAALQAAQKNPALTAPSDDPFVTDYQKEAQGYDAAVQPQQQALQKASEAEGHVQADKAALDYASKVVQSPDATEAQKQAFQQMQSAAHSDEAAAVAAREMFEQTDIHLSIARERASGALAGLAPPPAEPGASTKKAPLANRSAPGSHAAQFPAVVASSALSPLSPSSNPQVLVTPPTGGKPYRMSVNECVASYSPTGAVPTLEGLKHQLDMDETAYERLYKTAEEQHELKAEWMSEMRKAVQDVAWGVVDHGADEMLTSSKEATAEEAKDLLPKLDATKKEVREFRAEVVKDGQVLEVVGGDPEMLANLRARTAELKAQAQPLIARSRALITEEANLKGAERTLGEFKETRDFINWITDMDGPGKIEESNPIAKSEKGDINPGLEGVKQVLKIGVDLAWHGTPMGAAIGTASTMIDLSYDLAVGYFGYEQLKQMKQNDVTYKQAQGILAARIDRLNAEIGCYQKTNLTTAEAGR